MSAWSYSALTSFETCPKRHYHLRVAKDVYEPESQAITWGKSVHTALENRVVHGTPLPTGMTQWEPLMTKLLAGKGEVFAERQIAMTEQLTPTEWFAKDVWVRGVVDVGICQPRQIIAMDYKTGRQKDDHDQLRLFAALLLALYPEVDRVKTGFIWLQTNHITKATFERGDLVDIWNNFLPRVAKLNRAHTDQTWPVKPSGLCRAWCPVTQCPHNGRRT